MGRAPFMLANPLRRLVRRRLLTWQGREESNSLVLPENFLIRNGREVSVNYAARSCADSKALEVSK
jgi:hypothetical protein